MSESNNRIRGEIEKIDFSFNQGKKIAIVLLAYDRPEYTARVLDSIEKNKISAKIPIFLFVDGGPQTRQHSIIKDFANRKSLKYKYAIPRKRNIGCSANIINAREKIFEQLNFDSAFIIEDDLVLSENYIEHLLEANRILTHKYENIGMIQGWNPKGDDEQKDPNAFEIVENSHLWGYIMNREVWSEIREIMLKYRKQFHDHLPKNGNGKYHFEIPEHLDKVRQYFRDTLKNQSNLFLYGEKAVLGTQAEADKISTRLSRPKVATGQDAMTETALVSKGFVRLYTARNKSKNIGEWGLHQTPEIYKKHGLGKITYSSYDYNPEKFYVRIEK